LITTLNKKELTLYLTRQLNHFFPDNIKLKNLDTIVELSLKKIESNFKHTKLDSYWRDNVVFFNHLNADQYAIFIYYASNIAFEKMQDETLATKLFYLNKGLHSFHCMYNTKLPNIFLIIHGTGIVLGKAIYEDYLVICHGVTVGSNSKWESPKLGGKVTMYPNSSILGKSNIASNTCLANGTTLMDFNTQSGSLIVGKSPNLLIKKQKSEKFKIYFKEQ
jgi:serine O-acetyltransferase